MKIKSLIAACFAGFGLYFLITGTFSVIAAAMLILSSPSTEGTVLIMTAQYLTLCIPFLTGILLLLCSRRFSEIVCHFAKISDDETPPNIDPLLTISVACIVTGLVVAINWIPEMLRIGYSQFMLAASPQYAADHLNDDPHTALLVTPSIYILLALVLLLRAKTISRWLAARD